MRILKNNTDHDYRVTLDLGQLRSKLDRPGVTSLFWVILELDRAMPSSGGGTLFNQNNRATGAISVGGKVGT